MLQSKTWKRDMKSHWMRSRLGCQKVVRKKMGRALRESGKTCERLELPPEAAKRVKRKLTVMDDEDEEEDGAGLAKRPKV